MDARTKELIEIGRAMVCGHYIIEKVMNIYGEPSKKDEVYVFDRRGNVARDLHLQGDALVPVTLDEAKAWCEAND